MPELDAFTRAYIACALWSSTDNADESGGEPFDSNYDESDISPETLAEMVADCAKFQADNMPDLLAAHATGEYGAGGAYDAQDVRGDGAMSTAEKAGYDFWLTRNGHGAGFWARPELQTYDGAEYERITNAMVDSYRADPSADRSALIAARNAVEAAGLGARLTAAAKAYSAVDLYLGDDGRIYA